MSLSITQISKPLDVDIYDGPPCRT